jgi:hypothetical protein
VTAGPNARTAEQIRREIEVEREALATAVDDLRDGLGEATNVGAKLSERLPVAAGGALAAGFVLAGGVGATMRLLARRGREGHTKASFGPFRLVDRG